MSGLRHHHHHHHRHHHHRAPVFVNPYSYHFIATSSNTNVNDVFPSDDGPIATSSNTNANDVLSYHRPYLPADDEPHYIATSSDNNANNIFANHRPYLSADDGPHYIATFSDNDVLRHHRRKPYAPQDYLLKNSPLLRSSQSLPESSRQFVSNPDRYFINLDGYRGWFVNRGKINFNNGYEDISISKRAQPFRPSDRPIFSELD
ncbi:hypothetical protein AC249_AIPGENE2501 [Exaiptasia diaphana]|nr:hypothetical protein AC249_AIPGENE2501 [Exaiptasia diaphana]